MRSVLIDLSEFALDQAIELAAVDGVEDKRIMRNTIAVHQGLTGFMHRLTGEPETVCGSESKFTRGL